MILRVSRGKNDYVNLQILRSVKYFIALQYVAARPQGARLAFYKLVDMRSGALLVSTV